MLGNVTTKKGKRELCQQIIKSHKVGDRLEGNEYKQIEWILSNSPWWREKGGETHKAIEVGECGFYHTKCFVIVREDDTRVDISYIDAISPDNVMKTIIKALRYAVADIIADYRHSLKFPLKCPLTGKMIMEDECDIDHYDMRFDNMAKKWVYANGGEIAIIKQITYPDFAPGGVLPEHLKEGWRAFHNTHSKLRAVYAPANRSHKYE